MASAGRVLLISKGAWVSGTPYDPMDFVYYGGNSYVCKVSVSGSTTPDSDTTHWQVMASGFDPDLITQTITNDATKIASDAAVYTECQKLESNFAVIQTSNVASQAFSAGDYLTLEGGLYKVTSNIANGGTLTPGTNITSTSVGTQLDALNDSLAGKADGSVANNLTTTASGYVLDARQGKALNDSLTPTNQASATSFSVGLYGGYIYKIGRIGFISYLSDSTSWTAGTAKTLFTLPNAMKPVGTLYLMAFANSADPAYAFQVQISTGGVATATPNTSGAYRLAFTIAFVTNS